MLRRILPILLLAFVLAACSTTPDQASSGASGGTTAQGEEALNAEGLPEGDISQSALEQGPAPGSQEDLEINVGDRVFFGFDSAALDQAAQETLDRQAAWLMQFPDLTVTVEGHADERGTAEYNLALGERRAAAVKNYLTARGIAPDRILTISYGEERPVDPGHNEAAWALNRRAVTVVNVVN